MSCADCLHLDHEISWGYGQRVYKCFKKGEYHFEDKQGNYCPDFSSKIKETNIVEDFQVTTTID